MGQAIWCLEGSSIDYCIKPLLLAAITYNFDELINLDTSDISNRTNTFNKEQSLFANKKFERQYQI